MAGIAQADRAGDNASGGASGFQQSQRDRCVWRNPDGGALFGIEMRSVDVRDPAEIERTITAFAGASNGG
jgi:hypothetical protein